MPQAAVGLYIVLILGLALLICLPALLVGMTFGKKAALIVAASSIFLGVPVILLGSYLVVTAKPKLVPALPEMPASRRRARLRRP